MGAASGFGAAAFTGGAATGAGVTGAGAASTGAVVIGVATAAVGDGLIRYHASATTISTASAPAASHSHGFASAGARVGIAPPKLGCAWMPGTLPRSRSASALRKASRM